MKELETLTRTWFITLARSAYDATPMARHYADALLDTAVASSPQSLRETRDELNRLVMEARVLFSEYDKKSKGFHRSAMYTGRKAAFEDFINILAREVKLYDQRIATNLKNDGKGEEPYLTK